MRNTESSSEYRKVASCSPNPFEYTVHHAFQIHEGRSQPQNLHIAAHHGIAVDKLCQRRAQQHKPCPRQYRKPAGEAQHGKHHGAAAASPRVWARVISGISRPDRAVSTENGKNSSGSAIPFERTVLRHRRSAAAGIEGERIRDQAALGSLQGALASRRLPSTGQRILYSSRAGRGAAGRRGGAQIPVFGQQKAA